MNINYFFNTHSNNSWLEIWGILIGALIGILGSFLIEKYNEHRRLKKEVSQKEVDRREYIMFQYTEVISHLNAVISVRETLNSFLLKLDGFIDNTDINSDKYDVGVIFLPKMSGRPLSSRIQEKSAGSGYLDTKISLCYRFSYDLEIQLEDLRQQLDHTCNRNERLSFGKFNSAQIQKEMFVGNLREFREVISETVLGKNLPVQIKNLLLLQAGLKKMSETTKEGWVNEFNPNKNQNSEEIFNLINENLKSLAEDNIEITKAEKYFEETI